MVDIDVDVEDAGVESEKLDDAEDDVWNLVSMNEVKLFENV